MRGALDAAAGAADFVEIARVDKLGWMRFQYLFSDNSANKLLYIL